MRRIPLRARTGRHRWHRSHAVRLRRLRSEWLEDRQLLATWEVTTSGELGPGSLTQAIIDANASAGPDTILFNLPADDAGHVYYRDDGIPGQVAIANVTTTATSSDAELPDADPDWPHSWYSIQRSSPLPTIDETVHIDGYSQPDSVHNSNSTDTGLNTILRIELRGSGGGSGDGLVLNDGSAGSSIRGMAVNGFADHGISVRSSNNQLNGLFVGTDVSGNSAAGNGQGIYLASDENQIGGTAAAERNLLSGNRQHAVFVDGGSNNVVAGNLIGSDREGTAAVGNIASGVLIVSGSNNTIGGSVPHAGNVLTGNGDNGVTVVALPSSGNIIQQNLIGTDVTGQAAIPNGFYGVFTFDAVNTIVGGDLDGVGNVVSGNASHGIFFQGQSQGAIIRGNLIGVGKDGTTAIGNGGDGIHLQNTFNSAIGGESNHAGNAISNNALNGIVFVNATAPVNRVLGNQIGTDPAGTSASGNGFNGILVVDSTDIVIGDGEQGNVIAHNGTIGVNITGSFSGNNTRRISVRGNSIFDNVGLGIDLHADGPDFPQNQSVGPNGRQRFPIINEVQVGGDSTTIRGSLNTNELNTPFAVEFFASPAADPSDFGEGKTLIGMTEFTTGLSEFTAFEATVGELPNSQSVITATATNLATGETSEFSPAFTPGALPRFVVSNTSDAGPGSFRQAIIDANQSAGAATIEFDIPADDQGHVYYHDDGIPDHVSVSELRSTTEIDAGANPDPDWPHSWFAIAPQSKLPPITDSVTIDGYSQMSAEANTNPIEQGLNTILRIELNGTQAGNLGSDGLLQFTTLGSSTIKGLVLNRARGDLIQLQGFTGAHRIEGNFIGPDVSGTVAFADSGNGITTVSSNDNVIGGTTPSTRNLISANFATGIEFGAVSSNNQLAGNFIGTDRTGTKALGNNVGIAAREDNLIGGDTVDAMNVISGNAIGAFIAGSRMQHNRVGTDSSGQHPLGNSLVGIEVRANGSNTHVIENLVAFNQSGIRIQGASFPGQDDTTGNGNRLQRNSIHSNGGFGIEGMSLVIDSDDPESPMIDPDADVGPNQNQNYPVIESVIATPNQLMVDGSLLSTPNSLFEIELYANATRGESILTVIDADNGRSLETSFAQGRTFLGSIQTETDAAGEANFFARVPLSSDDEPFITAIATDITDDGNGPRNNSSPFSPTEPVGGCRIVVSTSGDGSGLGTLREALTCSNIVPGPQTIQFALPADDPRHFYYQDDGQPNQVSRSHVAVTAESDDTNLFDVDPDWPHSWFSLLREQPLPQPIDTITVDGFSQPGARPNTIPTPGGLNTVIKIELNGSAAGDPDGLHLPVGAEISRIQGLAINEFPDDGIQLDTFGGNEVVGNFIGTDVSGLVELPNGNAGVHLTAEQFNRIGGRTANLRNLIAGGSGAAILAATSGADLIQGNVIGRDRTGARSWPTDLGQASIVGNGVFFLTVGGTDDGAANLIDATDSAGVAIVAPNPTQSRSLDELERCRSLLNTVDERRTAFFDESTRDNHEALQSAIRQVLFCATIEGFLGEAQGNVVLGNRIAATNNAAGPGIDLGNDGVTPNDLGDDDGGANNQQNYPLLTSVVTQNGQTTILGELNSGPEATYRLEFFASLNRPENGLAQADQWLGATDVTTDIDGNASFEFAAVRRVTSGYLVTATSTRLFDFDGDPNTALQPLETSEFAAAVDVLGEHGVLGDFDNNDRVDAADIDLLAAAIRRGDTGPRYDLDESGSVDENDRVFLIEQILETTIGDSNLDGVFTSDDIVLTFIAGQYVDSIDGNSGWATGDWNGDGDFDEGDIVAAFIAGGYMPG